MAHVGQKIKWISQEGNEIAGIVLEVEPDYLEDVPLRSDPSRTMKARRQFGTVMGFMPPNEEQAGFYVPAARKNLAFTAPRFSTVEGLDVLDGEPIDLDALTSLALRSQAQRTAPTIVALEDLAPAKSK